MASETRYGREEDARSSAEAAQWWLLYAVMVANKPADQTETKLTHVLASAGAAIQTPFERIRTMAGRGDLGDVIRHERTGQYTRIEAAFRDVAIKLPPVAGDDPRNWSLETIQSIPGVGPKTARWYWLLLYPEAPVAALDTHVLKFLRDNGSPDAPRATPPAGRRYRMLERTFVTLAHEIGTTPRELDYFAWAVYRNGGQILLSGGRDDG